LAAVGVHLVGILDRDAYVHISEKSRSKLLLIVAQCCRDYRADATGIKDWKEIEVNTGLKHGFLFRPMKEWVAPTVAWGKR